MKTVISVIALFLSLLLAGCTNVESKTPQPSDVSEVAAKNETISEPILIVEFRESGSIYEYSGFTTDDWDSFSSADSLGGYFNQKIKGNYPYERIY